LGEKRKSYRILVEKQEGILPLRRPRHECECDNEMDIGGIWTSSVVKWSEFLATERRCILLPVRYELDLYMLRKRK
jgi:hypothetical protein